MPVGIIASAASIVGDFSEFSVFLFRSLSIFHFSYASPIPSGIIIRIATRKM